MSWWRLSLRHRGDEDRLQLQTGTVTVQMFHLTCDTPNTVSHMEALRVCGPALNTALSNLRWARCMCPNHTCALHGMVMKSNWDWCQQISSKYIADIASQGGGSLPVVAPTPMWWT